LADLISYFVSAKQIILLYSGILRRAFISILCLRNVSIEKGALGLKATVLEAL
jgi:hypothetical protein